MPSINHLANNRLAFNSHSAQKKQLKSHSFNSAAKPHFGMQSAALTEDSGCLNSVLKFFRNLFSRRQTSVPVVPNMQERTPLRGNRDLEEGPDYLSLSNESAPVLPISVPQPVRVQVTERHPTAAYSPSKPIPITRKDQDSTPALPDNSFIPSSPPEVRRDKERMRRLLSDKY